MEYQYDEHPLVQKHRGTIKGVVNYKFALPYREVKITGKPQKQHPKVIQVNLSEIDKAFNRKNFFKY